MFVPFYLILAIFVFGMNIIPAFMPPTWLVLAYFYTHYHLSLIPTVAIGATCATLGRIVLSRLARNYLRPFLPKQIDQNYNDLGSFFKKNQNLTIPVVVSYAFLPIPSNDVFIIAGLAGLPIKLIASSFFAGRLVSYTFWILVSANLVVRLEGLFSQRFSNYSALIGELIGFLIIFLVGKIHWRRVLRLRS